MLLRLAAIKMWGTYLEEPYDNMGVLRRKLGLVGAIFSVNNLEETYDNMGFCGGN